jgi:anti-sigma factor (TIGR02949 family)
MNSCDDHRVNILRFLDNELTGRELEEFSSHMRICAECRALLNEEQQLSRLLRGSRPLYTAPDELRARVSADIASRSKAKRPSPRIYDRALSAIGLSSTQFIRWGLGWRTASAALLVVLCAVFIPGAARRVSAASYEATAVASHRRYISGTLPLQIQSGSPEAVAAWFAGKVPFVLRLPLSQADLGGKAAYHLTGAALVDYKNSRAALITYETTGKDKISLLIASCKSAEVAGGEEVRSGGLVFHYHNQGDLKVITWSTHGLAYALVSAISGSAKGSCLVCHENMTDHQAFTSNR